MSAVLFFRDPSEENLPWLQTNPDIFQQIVKHYREYRYPFIPNLDPDASLYQIGFYSRADEKLCRLYQRASPEKKAQLVDQFTSPDARTLAWRVLGRNYPDTLPAEFAGDLKNYMERINPLKEEDAMVDYREDKRTTPAGTLIEIKRLKQTGDLNDNQHRLLNDLESYIRNKFKN